MKYEQVWDAVDKLARAHGLSPSGLAKKAGLDATTFNKSKRIRPDGKKDGLRWTVSTKFWMPATLLLNSFTA